MVSVDLERYCLHGKTAMYAFALKNNSYVACCDCLCVERKSTALDGSTKVEQLYVECIWYLLVGKAFCYNNLSGRPHLVCNHKQVDIHITLGKTIWKYPITTKHSTSNRMEMWVNTLLLLKADSLCMRSFNRFWWSIAWSLIPYNR